MKHLARIWARRPEVGQVGVSGDRVWGFWTGKGDHGIDVFCAALKGGHPEQLTFGPDHHEIRDISADGMRLILGQSRNGSGHDHLLLLDRTLGNRLRLLTPKQESHHLTGGVFAGDGVIFASDEGGEAVLWREDLGSGRREALARLPDLPQSMAACEGRLLLRGPEGLWLWDGGLRPLLQMPGLKHAAWIDAGRIAVLGAQAGVLSLDGGVEWLGPATGIAAGLGRFALADQVENPSTLAQFHPQIALAQGWLGVARDPCAPPEVWGQRRLDVAHGPVLDAAELTPFGPLWRPAAPKGLVVLAQDSAGVGFFSALGWAVLALRDPARLSEAMAALDLPAKVCRMDGAAAGARGVIAIGPQALPEDLPILRVHLGRRILGPGPLRYAARRPGPDLHFSDETHSITRPANLEAFFLRAAAFLETL